MIYTQNRDVITQPHPDLPTSIEIMTWINNCIPQKLHDVIISPYLYLRPAMSENEAPGICCILRICIIVNSIYFGNKPWSLFWHWILTTSLFWQFAALCSMQFTMVLTLRPWQNGRHFQTAFSNTFSWMKMYKFRLRFQWSLFSMVQLTIFQHWFR